jgi:hypothetical protein
LPPAKLRGSESAQRPVAQVALVNGYRREAGATQLVAPAPMGSAIVQLSTHICGGPGLLRLLAPSYLVHAKSQTRIFLSAAPDASHRPSGEKATE